MNIFIAFGYNENDEWIKELVFPLVQAFDASIVTGEDLHGEIITEGVSERIKKCDGVIGFLTRREALQSGRYVSHRWVSDELATAIGCDIPAVEVKDRLVDVSGGIPGDRQRIEFDLGYKAFVLVELAKVLSKWRHNFKTKRLILLPKEIVQDARPHIANGQLKCIYQFMSGSKRSQPFQTNPFRFGQGLCVDVNNVPSESALIQITLQGPQFSWSSDYESIELLTINLQKD